MFDITSSITTVKPEIGYKKRYIGEIVYTQEHYMLKYNNTMYKIKRLHRYIGETIYSTHLNDKHPIGTSREVSDIIDPENLKLINKFWYKIYEGMKVEFHIISKDVVSIEFDDYVIRKVSK